MKRIIALRHLHALAAALDFLGLALVLLQARFLVPAAQADRRILVLTACVVPIALVVFLLVPRRVSFQAETTVPRRSLMVVATLAVPVIVTLLTLLAVGLSGSFDSFAGFALVLAADTGRNLCEWLRQRPWH